jgi:tetratricopeptide (TPR) repeat protein
MTARLTVSRLLAPLAVFGAVLAVMVALHGGATSPPALSAGGDLGRPSGDPLRDAQAAVRAAPGSPASYAALGDAYLARARETGDPSFYTRAERAFGAALRRDARDVGALVGAGTLAGLRHDFGAQLRLGTAASKVAPELARPLTVIADAQLELGRYGDGARTIQRLVNLKPGLPAYARVSYYRELTGDPAGAVGAMRFASSAGGSAESVAYVRSLTGDLELARGRVPAARAAYREALRALPGYPQALTGLARVDVALAGLAPAGAARDRLASAAARLRRSARGLPLAGTLTVLAEIERSLGRHRAARADLAAARAQHRLLASSGTLPDAEAVLFEANHGSPRRAVELGRRVWERAPSIRSADALGWALVRAGRPRVALAWARRALATGSRDPVFRLHAGVAARRSGRRGEAERWLTAAVKGAAALSPASIRLLEEARS